MRLYYRKATHPTLKASMGALMAAEKNPVRTLVIGPFAITWARHAETDKTTYTRVIEALTVAQYSEEYKLNKARAEAWSLGVGVGMFCGPHDIPPNPYRQKPGDQDADLNPSNSMGLNEGGSTNE